MPHVQIRFHPAAAAEVEAAVQWYASGVPSPQTLLRWKSTPVWSACERPLSVGRGMCTERVGISFRIFLLVWSIGSVTGRSKSSRWYIIGGVRATGGVGKPCASAGAPGDISLATDEKNYAKAATALQY